MPHLTVEEMDTRKAYNGIPLVDRDGDRRSVVKYDDDIQILDISDDEAIEILYEGKCSTPNKRPRLGLSPPPLISSLVLPCVGKRRLFPSKESRLIRPRIYSIERNRETNQNAKLEIVQKKQGTATFSDLPNELISEILGSLQHQSDVLACRLVSKAWNELSCIHLRQLHAPVQLDRPTQLNSFLDLLRRRIHGQRFPYTSFRLNLSTLSRRSIQFFLSQSQITIRKLILTTEGNRKRSKPQVNCDEPDTLHYILQQLPRLAQLTIEFHHTVSSDLPMVIACAEAAKHISSFGLVNVALNPTLKYLAPFDLLRAIPLRLTKLQVDLRKPVSSTADTQKQLVQDFYQWLQSHAHVLVDLSVNTCLRDVKLPVLPHLQRLAVGVHAIEPHGLDTFGSFLPTQFPVLTEVDLSSFLLRKTAMKYDSGIQAFSSQVFPTVESLRLDHISPEAHYDASFPNLKRLEVGPNVTVIGLRNVLSYFLDVEELVIRFSPVQRDWWGALTGGAKRIQQEFLACSKAVVDVERETILGGPRRGSCCLGYLTELKSLKLENCHAEVLDALVYLTVNKFVRPLEKLFVATIESGEYPEELVDLLQTYHGSVVVEC